MRQQLADAAKGRGGDLSTLIRQAVMTYLEATETNASTPPRPSSDAHSHDLDVCACTLLQRCVPELRGALEKLAQALKREP
jgi:hypothetical protein